MNYRRGDGYGTYYGAEDGDGGGYGDGGYGDGNLYKYYTTPTGNYSLSKLRYQRWAANMTLYKVIPYRIADYPYYLIQK